MTIKRMSARFTLISLALLLFATASAPRPAYAAVPALDQIRVAIIMNLPGKYVATLPAATFSSGGGLAIGVREPDGVKPWLTAAASQRVRLAADDYKVRLFEGGYAAALGVYQHAATVSSDVYLTSAVKNGVRTYQVSEGAYPTVAEAQAALGKWSADAKLASLLGGFKSLLSGPLHLETGAYASKAAAQSAAEAFGKAGLDAVVAVRANAAGEAAYSVMVGAEATEDGLKKVQVAASETAEGKSLKAADPGSRYMLIRQDHGLTGSGEIADELYLFPLGDMKVWLSPAGTQPIQLTERSNRTYRGSFEVGSLNGKLAVINELPFEQYLYSVVGAEISASWPLEAQKAQAVAARSYALNKGFGFQIAHVVDTTLSQAYYGTGYENPSSIEGVDATKGEVALYNGSVIEALFSSSSGGMTSDAIEVWGNEVPYLKPVTSPDQVSETSKLYWLQVALPSGQVGYIREDLLRDTGSKTAAGSKIMELTTDNTNVRKHPLIQSNVPVVAQLQQGTRVVAIGRTIESNEMNWIRGPFSGAELLTTINARVNPKLNGPITSVQVTGKGPSGRVTEIQVNGSKLSISSPDSLRSILGVGGSLPSTLFQVIESGKIAMLGASGNQRVKADGSQSVYVAGADGKAVQASGEHLFILDGKGEMRAATQDASFTFVGTGNGHGVGMSQYGALALAQQGYDYQYILKYYYNGITIAKE